VPKKTSNGPALVAMKSVRPPASMMLRRGVLKVLLDGCGGHVSYDKKGPGNVKFPGP